MDAKESTTVMELKKMVQGITKRKPEDMKLFKESDPLEDMKTLGDCGYTSSNARAQAPATIGLAFRLEEGGDFEPLEIAALSPPPELPDVMKPQESSSHTQEQVSSPVAKT